MIRFTALLFGLVGGFLFSGCASIKYDSIPKGTFTGRATLEWVAADKFIYWPDAVQPLTFTRANGEIIRPQAMFTDGGSIPRPLWALRNYSPWGYGPAFLIHDWIFDAHHCSIPDYRHHTLDTAADVMSECIKTLIESGVEVPNSKSTLVLMDFAVRSSFAKQAWDNGRCNLPPERTNKDIRTFGVEINPFKVTLDFGENRR